jgi:hypothetical protein
MENCYAMCENAKSIFFADHWYGIRTGSVYFFANLWYGIMIRIFFSRISDPRSWFVYFLSEFASRSWSKPDPQRVPDLYERIAINMTKSKNRKKKHQKLRKQKKRGKKKNSNKKRFHFFFFFLQKSIIVFAVSWWIEKKKKRFAKNPDAAYNVPKNAISLKIRILFCANYMFTKAG